MKVWVLTEAYNDYDQHGEYFLACFKEKPTPDQLQAEGVEPGRVDHVLAGGGREGAEYQYYYLREEEAK